MGTVKSNGLLRTRRWASSTCIDPARLNLPMTTPPVVEQRPHGRAYGPVDRARLIVPERGRGD
ncbi:hypothetical protein GCM10010230_24000 [Streptomyces narbonensis]|nr:hypothetical protein GCM10010230_24000 [Streptomyces narbonensis]